MKFVHWKDGRLFLRSITWNRAWPPREITALLSGRRPLQQTRVCPGELQYQKGTGGGTNLPAVTPGGSARLWGRFHLLPLNVYLQFLQNTASHEVLGEKWEHGGGCSLCWMQTKPRKIISADGVGNTFFCLSGDLQHWKLKWPFQGLHHRHLRYWGWFWETTGPWGTPCYDWLESQRFFACQGWYKTLCRSWCLQNSCSGSV